jgi:phosphotransferase system HPr (HPr) family protein
MSTAPAQDHYAERMVTIRNPHGLHMRPAMEFVDQANRYKSEITIQKVNKIVDGKSIFQVTQLVATFGTELKVTATGCDAQEAVEVLTEILGREKPQISRPSTTEDEGICQEPAS